MHHRFAAALVLPLTLAACMAEPAHKPTLAAATQSAVQCVPVNRIAGRAPLDARTLRFEMADGVVYHNRLPQRCPPLENAGSFDVITLELQGTQLCSGDSFRVVDAAELRALGPSAFLECRIGPFVPVGAPR